MSIASTVAALERANAAYKAAQAAATPVAKRGMFAMVERRHCYSSLLCGAYAGYVGYTPCLVSSVTRDGIVNEVRLAGQSWTLKRRDWERVMVDTAGKITEPATVVARLVDDRGMAIEYRDQGEQSAPSRQQPASIEGCPQNPSEIALPRLAELMVSGASLSGVPQRAPLRTRA
jgi:hypothetical protein